ncbi:MAG: DUF4097 family beta strand repeat-containing protein [Halobacteriota archaeon]|nr:DUF4097 family beta strand repeat-containing protein [Halobacteriota archaeon]
MARRYHTAFILIVLIVVTSLSGCTGEAQEITEEFNSEYEVHDDTVLKVITFNGEIKIESWDGDTVVLNAIKRTRFGQNEFENVKIEVSESEGELIIETKHLKDWVSRVSVDISLKVPDNVAVEYVKTSNGNIEIKGTEGIGDLDSSNGDIEVEVLDIARDIEIKSKNGAIDVYLNPSLNADIDASTSNGEISMDDLELELVSSSRDEIKGKLGDGGSRIEISTANGDVDLFELDFYEEVEEGE